MRANGVLMSPVTRNAMKNGVMIAMAGTTRATSRNTYPDRLPGKRKREYP